MGLRAIKFVIGPAAAVTKPRGFRPAIGGTPLAPADLVLASALLVMAGARTAEAQTLAPQERLCDPAFQDCRADLLKYINQETVGIDAGFWLMDDDYYRQALRNAFNRGVKVRILMDPRCTTEHPACQQINDYMKADGLPMRKRVTSGILHWKMMLFAGQGQMEFAGANYSPYEFKPATPWVNYTGEVIYYTNDPSLIHSFMEPASTTRRAIVSGSTSTRPRPPSGRVPGRTSKCRPVSRTPTTHV